METVRHGLGELLPANWDEEHLVKYCIANNICTNPHQSSSTDVVAEVTRHLVAHGDPPVEQLRQRDIIVDDLLGTPASELLGYKVQPRYADVLRENVDKLQELISVGIEQLQDLQYVCNLFINELEPPLHEWLMVVARGSQKGQSVQEILSASPSAVCGRFLTFGQVAAQCQDCMADTTCVMCIDCFERSPCRGHNYRLLTSSGGMCDCGDDNAWNPQSFCTAHKGHRAGDDPTLNVSPEQGRWISAVIRGLVQLNTIVLQQNISLLETQCPECVPLDHRRVARAIKYNWSKIPRADLNAVAQWLLPSLQLLEELGQCNDSCRRYVSLAWMGVAPLSRGPHDPSTPTICLEEVFLLGVVGNMRKSQGWKALVDGVANCLSDPIFRVAFCGLFLRYHECIRQPKQLAALAVQVFTSKDVVEHFLQPSCMDSGDNSNTIVHRLCSSLLYSMCEAREEDADLEQVPRCAGLIRLQSDANLSAGAAHDLDYALMASKRASAVAVTSRVAFRSVLTVLQVLALSAPMRKLGYHEDASHPRLYTCELLSWALLPRLWSMQAMMRDTMARLEEGLPLIDDENLLLALQSCTRLDPVPAGFLVREDHTQLVARCAVEPDDNALLLDPSTPPGNRALAYAQALLSEVLRAVCDINEVQRRLYCKNNTDVVLARDLCPVYSYDLFDPSAHSTTFFSHHIRMLAFVLKAWMMHSSPSNAAPGDCPHVSHLPIGCRLPVESPSIDVKVTLAQGDSNAPERVDTRLLPLIHFAFSGAERRQQTEHLFDALVMPFVLTAQVRSGMWRRGDYGVDEIAERHFGQMTKITVENDVFLLQILTVSMGPQDFAMRLLERFSYKTDDICWAGHSYFLQLLLTVVLDTSKANTYHEVCQKSVQRLVAQSLSRKRMLHSEVLDHVIPAIGGRREEVDEPGMWGKTSIAQLVGRSLDAITVSERGQNGLVYRLKDTQTWRDTVDFYAATAWGSSLQDVYTMYRSIANLENVTSKKDEQRNNAPDGSPVTLPLTEFRTATQHPELLPYVRALLHTDAVLVTAMHAVWSFWMAHASSRSVKSGGPPHVHLPSTSTPMATADADSSPESYKASTQDTAVISKYHLHHAVTALYLCAKDCIDISVAMAHELGVSVGDNDPVVWEYVDDYFQHYVSGTTSFSSASVQQYMAWPELISSGSLRDRLARQLPLDAVATIPSPVGDPLSATAGSERCSTADVLHDILWYYRNNTEGDCFGCIGMIQHILRITGLARADVLCGERDKVEAVETLNRQQQLKERQVKLLERMKLRGVKAASRVLQPEDRTGTTKMMDDVGATSDGAENRRGVLHTHLLLDLSTVECCVCRTIGHSPLLLLGHTSTSRVLGHLQSVQLPDGRGVHSHVYLCGHAAHQACVQKVFGRLAQLWLRGSFRGQRYLTSSEFGCPICMMICNITCPLPVLSSNAAAGGPATPEVPSDSPKTLFEDIRTCTLQSHADAGTVPGKRPAVLDTVYTNLALSNIGCSKSEDGGFLIREESKLQKNHSEAWEVAEAIRAIYFQLHLLLEGVKLGIEISKNGLVTLLALLVAVDPTELAACQAAIEAHFLSNGESFCVWLMQMLMHPCEVPALANKWALSLSSLPLVKEVLDPVLSNDDTAVCSRGGDAHGEVRMALWKELGCMTLICLLLADEPSPTVLVCSADVDQPVELLTLTKVALSSVRSRSEAIRRMWQALTQAYSMEQPVPTDEVASIISPPTLFVPTIVPYRDPEQWTRHVWTDVLHLSLEYTQNLTTYAQSGRCCVCDAKPKLCVLCTQCGRYLCLRPNNSAPELLSHTRTCCGGVGLYLIIRDTSFIILDAVSGRTSTYDSIYTDSFGEMDEGLRRGFPLQINTELGVRLLRTWLFNRWGVDSVVIKRTWLGSISIL